MIQQAGVEDISRLTPLGDEFFREASLPGPFDAGVFTAYWVGLIESGAGAIFFSEDASGPTAAIGGVCLPDFNTGHVVAVEMFWFCTKAARSMTSIRLVNAYEQWASGRGAQRVCMVHLATDRANELRAFYARRGYRPLECYYWKDLE